MKEQYPGGGTQEFRVEDLEDNQWVIWDVPEFGLSVPTRGGQVKVMAQILKRKRSGEVRLRVEGGEVIMRVVSVRPQRRGEKNIRSGEG